MAKEKPFNWAEYVRNARTTIPHNLGYTDERWTQVAFAAMLGVTSNYIAMVERDEKEPSDLFKRALNFALQMSANGLDPRAL